VPVGVNPARFVTCDEMSYLSSEIVDFHGVKCAWVETMDVKVMMHALSHMEYQPVTGNRYTTFIYKAGKPVLVPPQPQCVRALGAALFARRFQRESGLILCP
jgi:hypothetical protein